MKQVYDEETLAKVKAGLKGMAKKEIVTKRKLVEDLAEEIRGKMREGYTLAEIAEVLAANDVEIKPSTLRFYLAEAAKATVEEPSAARRKAASRPKAKAVTPAAPRLGGSDGE